MNILASYNWIKEYLKIDVSADDFAREFSLRSMSVEAIEKSENKYANMVVGLIKEIKQHPKADRLRIAITDVGANTVEIVCGGTNIEVGQKVFVALPGAKVRWHGEGELVELAETEIRGVKSVGMICSPIEVGFDKLQGAEREIWDLSKVTDAQPGRPIAEALDLNDAIFDIEITTNRPDCMGIIGLAREAGAALSAEFTSSIPALPQTSSSLQVSLQAKKLCPRYMAASLKNVKVGPSPWWLQKKLLQSGHRPINNIVDITNLVLHEYGQPLHAFDATKLEGNQIVVRTATKGEKIKALDGKDYPLSSKHLVIADARKPLAVAGVMGGLESGTTESTTRVVFEAATFDPVSIRKTARDLNLYSDSQLVFEKGLSTEALPAALARAIELAMDIAGAELEGITDARLGEYKAQTYPVVFKKIRSRIGVEIPDNEIKQILERLGFKLDITGSRVIATVPYWRDHDIEAEIDLTEEVARIFGYHRLTPTLPAKAPPTLMDDISFKWGIWAKRLLAQVGYTEFYGYSFIDSPTLEKYGLSPANAVKVFNPLSDDLSHLRPSLMPSLLRDIERNQANRPQAKVFELARTYKPKAGDLPDENLSLVVAEYGNENAEQAYMNLRGTLELLGNRSGLKFTVAGEADEHWHPSRSALVQVEVDGSKQTVGTLGQVANAYQQAFGIVRPVFVLELDFEALLTHFKQTSTYQPVSEFPIVQRDLSFVVSERTAFEALVEKLKAQNVLITKIELVDIYRGEGVAKGQKSVTLSITFASEERTLTSAEVEEVMITLGHILTGEFKATLRS